MRQFIGVEHARQAIVDAVDVLGVERVFVAQAPGRILAQPIVAPSDSPAFDNSARDGYALRHDDLHGDDLHGDDLHGDDLHGDDLHNKNLAGAHDPLDICGTVPAGQAPDLSVQPGTAARILTGAALPDGADTVVMQEDCRVDEQAGTVEVVDPDGVGRGDWVRHAGENMAAGQTILSPGAELGPAAVGLLASFGRSTVSVRRRPRVAIVSTGDELVDIDLAPGAGQIVNSNAYMLEALVQDMGAEAIVMPTAGDDEDIIRQRFETAVDQADLVISSGGVSVGDFDLTGRVVDQMAGGIQFWKVRIKPGKPLAFGTVSTGRRRVGLIGLPGNPNSCFVGFHQFVRPALSVLQGADPDTVGLPRLRATLADDVQTTDRRRVYLSGRLDQSDDGPAVFHAADNQNSANLSLFCGADAFGLVDEGVGRLYAGDDIWVELF